MFIYLLLRLLGGIISLLPYKTLHALGRLSGFLIFYLHRPFRKKTLTNIEIAFKHTKSPKEKRKLAIRSFQNLTITCLEFFRLKRSKKNLSEIVKTEGGDEILALLKERKGIVFLTGHQANWEIPFLALTQLAPGVAIGRPIKNRRLYKWILSVREMNGGKIILPKNALKFGMEALNQGKFLGIVGDQAFPESSYSYPLFGTRAWTTTAPALIAYKTNSPLVVGFTKRVKGHYVVSASPLLWPDTTKPLKEEVHRLMNEAIGYLEKSIKERPWEWLWQHDRWKQQGIDRVKRKYRFGFILVILPPNSPDLPFWVREIYPRSFLSFLVPEGEKVSLPDVEIYSYKNEEDLLLNDYRYQLVLDFYDSKKARRHYLKRGAFKALHMKKMKTYAPPASDLKTILQKTLIKPECQ